MALGELHRYRPNPTGPAMDEYPLSGAELHRVHSARGRYSGQSERGGLLEAECLRLGGNGRSRCDRVLGLGGAA